MESNSNIAPSKTNDNIPPSNNNLIRKYLTEASILLALISAIIYMVGFTYEYNLYKIFGFSTYQFVEYGPALLIRGSNTISALLTKYFWIVLILISIVLVFYFFKDKIKIRNQKIIIISKLLFTTCLIILSMHLIALKAESVYDEYVRLAKSDEHKKYGLHKQKVTFIDGYDSPKILITIRYANNTFAFLEDKTAKLYIFNERNIKKIESLEDNE